MNTSYALKKILAFATFISLTNQTHRFVIRNLNLALFNRQKIQILLHEEEKKMSQDVYTKKFTYKRSFRRKKKTVNMVSLQTILSVPIVITSLSKNIEDR